MGVSGRGYQYGYGILRDGLAEESGPERLSSGQDHCFYPLS